MIHRVTKSMTTETAHRLRNHLGGCKNIHGHRYLWEVTVQGEVDPATGMIIDFAELKAVMKEVIEVPFDHALVLCTDDVLYETLKPYDIRLTPMIVEPTAENFSRLVFDLLGTKLPSHIQVVKVRVWETATSVAECV